VIWRSIGLLVVGCLTSAAGADERSESLIKAFQAFCTLPSQSLDELDAKASAQKLKTDYEEYYSARGRTKTWFVDAGDWRYRLAATRMIAADGVQTNVCGVAASEMIDADVKADLVKSLQLGSPSRQGRGGGFHATGTMSVWKMMIGSEEMSVVLIEERDMRRTEVLIGRNFEPGR
jgi:hypothetical protein